MRVVEKPILPPGVTAGFSGWGIGVLFVALLLSIPVLLVVGSIFEPTGEVWHHLVQTVLREYLVNSLTLMVGVAIGVVVLGVGTAWLTSMCQFPGRALFEWALLLPMAIPAYIIAYTYTGLFDFAGPLQTALRDWTGWGYGDYWFPEIRSLQGAVLMLSLVLYPYVYLLCRAAFLSQSLCVLDVSRTLGKGPWRSFFSVALPLARPAIVAGLSLALMETLADYGTVHYFGVATFTTGIFRTWFGLNNPVAAMQLSALMLLVVFGLIIVERLSRHGARYHHTTQRHQSLARFRLDRRQAGMAILICSGILFFAFLLPAGQLLWWALSTAGHRLDRAFLILLGHSLMLAAGASLLALLLALFFGYGKRLRESWLVTLGVRVAGMGYAIPGTVIAVGVVISFSAFDNALDQWARGHLGGSTGLLLSGTLAALLFAYLVRFLAVSLQTVEAGLGKIRPTLDEVARSMGTGAGEILRRIHVPMLKGSLMTALLLVFVDVLKELPATLILRPFNFNTLAVRAYELASDERLADASHAALAIVVAGIFPVILLSRSITGSRHATTT